MMLWSGAWQVTYELRPPQAIERRSVEVVDAKPVRFPHGLDSGFLVNSLSHTRRAASALLRLHRKRKEAATPHDYGRGRPVIRKLGRGMCLLSKAMLRRLGRVAAE